MDWTHIIGTLITAGATIAVALISRGIKKNNSEHNAILLEKYHQLENKVEVLTWQLEDNNLRTMRLDLDRAIDTDPDNIIVIMDMAQKYFIDMHGNCYMSKKFQEWANVHNVNITGLFNKD